MSSKAVINTFTDGMNKDVDKSLLSNKAYLDAQNFRIVTTQGGSTGVLENVKGNRSLELDLLQGQMIIGSCEIRDKIVLFTTDNSSTFPGASHDVQGTTTTTTLAPHTDGDRSMIYVITVDLESETQTTELIYDDYYSVNKTTLNFSTAYPIKAIGRYETPNIQKVYWTDGYNNIRYINIEDNLTIDGEPFVQENENWYLDVDRLEFLPVFTPFKPLLIDVIGGNVNTGMIAYSYQLYIANGAETSFSPLSDPIHVVSDNDFLSNTLNYRGNKESINSGKGFIIGVGNENIGYNRLRLIRVEYSTLNATPKIYIANEVAISIEPSEISITDTGGILGELTIDEFNIQSTELFKCEDIATKDNRLFAANITKSEFIVDPTWDARAVRFGLGFEGGSVDSTPPMNAYDHNGPGGQSDVTITKSNDNSVLVTITNFSSYITVDPSRTFSSVLNVSTSVINNNNVIAGVWLDGSNNQYSFNSTATYTSIQLTEYNSGTDTLTYTVTTSNGNYFDASYISMYLAVLTNIVYTYAYTPDTVEALVANGTLGENPGLASILPDFSNWVDRYPLNHDGVNYSNYEEFDNASNAYVYQSDGETLGAEGPNILISFDTEEIVLDDSNITSTFYVSTPTDDDDKSYKNYASPWKDGKLSWQRDEVYRLFVVFGNERGQTSEPKWICDLRMPSLHDLDYGVLAKMKEGYTDIFTQVLFPTVQFKSFPENASWAQIHRVKRERKDRSVVTQGIAIPSYDFGENGVDYQPLPYYNNSMGDAAAPFKIVSPEISITKNISLQSNDYIEYIANWDGEFTISSDISLDDISMVYMKCKQTSIIPFTMDTRTLIKDAKMVLPSSGLVDYITLDGKKYYNATVDGGITYSKGCSGLLVSIDNANWTGAGGFVILVNYKSSVFTSQYGGLTYEDRANNVSIPCSDIITDFNLHDIRYGDTYINYFDVSTFLVDLAVTPVHNVTTALAETVYVPVESSINCDLRHDTSSAHMNYSIPNSILRQEYAGTHDFDDGTYVYEQELDLYLYNTVYSQQIDLKYAIPFPLDKILETKFDTMIKASNKKTNGEMSDSWSKFGINEFIEVDSKFGPVNAISYFNNNIYYFQDMGVGVVAVNDRSLINDAAGAQLVLGTGGVLDRFDYISTQVGCKDKFSVVDSQGGIYWFHRLSNSIFRHSNNLTNLSKVKYVQSYFTTEVTSSMKAIAHADVHNDEILFSFFNENETSGFTISFNEAVDAFISFYSFIPVLYIPYQQRYMTVPFGRLSVWLHDTADINLRNVFYGYWGDSTIELLFNPEYESTKVFDNLFYISKAIDENGLDLFEPTFSKVQCYNDYQNTGEVEISYKGGLERRERTWSLVVPRSIVSVESIESPDIWNSTDSSQLFKERMRDKYLIVYLTYTNDENIFTVSNVGLRYRNSIR